ncbi:MAG: SpoIID/LytB domain-containing protein [Planctomycetota bacterium]|jgi:stage II sporulation protein D
MTRNTPQQNGALTLVGIASLAALMTLAVVACQELLVAPTHETHAPYEPEIKVRLEQNLASATLEGQGLVRVGTSSQAGTYALRLPVEIRIAEDAIHVQGSDATMRRFEVSNSTTLACVVTPDPSSPLEVGDVLCAWPLEVVISTLDGARTFDLIERVPLESYLPGVLAQELYPSWSPIAYRAQAIAARSYALHEMQRRDRLASHYHVERTTRDQAYAGQTDNQTALDAVRDTRGVVLTFNDHILRAYYSSTCGGRAGSARHTWPTTVGYAFNLDVPLQAHLRDCPCETSPRYRWTIERDASAFARRLSAYGKSRSQRIARITAIESIQVARRNVAGRPASYTIRATNGEVYSLPAEDFRVASNYPRDSSLPEVTSKTRILSGDLEVTTDSSTIHFEGRGFGHGVGLCQFGTQALALEGQTPSWILAHYYPGAIIERAY